MSSKASFEDLKDMDFLCTFKIKIESKLFEQGCISNQWLFQNQVNIPNPSQEPPVFSKAPHQVLKEVDVLHTFEIKVEN